MTSNENGLQEHYKRAMRDFAARAIVFLAAANDLQNRALTGVLVCTKKGRVLLLTARHMGFDDDWQPLEWRPLRMYLASLDKDLVDVGVDIHVAPNCDRPPERPVDVAAIELRRDLDDLLRPLAVPLSVIAEDDDTRATDVIVVSGFPAYLAFPSPKGAKKILLSTMHHTTGILGRDDLGRLKVEWDEAVPDRDTPVYPHLNLQPGELMKLGKPLGISGGAVWRIRGGTASDVWSPASHMKMIGVPVSFLSPVEFAESVTAWGPWLRGFAHQLDTR